MKNNAIYCILMAGALLTACSDELLDINGNDGEQSGLLFSMTTEEMGQEVVLTGTRAALTVRPMRVTASRNEPCRATIHSG